MREEVRPGRREGVGWRRRSWPARGGPDSRAVGARARAERTANMPSMDVTLDVSQLEMSALKFVKDFEEKRELMSVMAETSQLRSGRTLQ